VPASAIGLIGSPRKRHTNIMTTIEIAGIATKTRSRRFASGVAGKRQRVQTSNNSPKRAKPHDAIMSDILPSYREHSCLCPCSQCCNQVPLRWCRFLQSARTLSRWHREAIVAATVPLTVTLPRKSGCVVVPTTINVGPLVWDVNSLRLSTLKGWMVPLFVRQKRFRVGS
jgi:hypothetical protein